jgi:AcrR family transcriptional regulator
MGNPVVESGIGKRRALARKEANPAYLAKRSEMIRAATLLFKEKGFEATTLNDIAEAFGSDRASLYYYFGSKEELLREAVGGVTQDNLEMVKALRDTDLDVRERIRQFVDNMIRSYDENYPQVFVYIQEDMTKVSGKKDPWAKTMVQQSREFEDAVLALIRDGVEDGSFRDDLDVEIVAKALWGMLNWTHRWHKPGQRAADDIARTFTAVFLDGVTTSA